MAKRKHAEAASQPEASEMADDRGVAQRADAAPDIFDDVIAQRKAAEAGQPSREPGDDTASEEPARGGITRKQVKPAPDPRGMHIISLSPDPKGPKARLLRSNDHEAMLIQFSEKPEPEILDQLRESGFRWENRAHSDFARGAWIIGLEAGNEWRNHAHAEEVFKNVVNQIRAKNNMEPFVPGAGQSL